MQLPVVKQAPRLRALPDLEPYEIHVGALNSSHIGRTIAIKTNVAVVAGPLTSITESRLMGKARLIIHVGTDSIIGELILGLHPAHPVTVLPTDHTLAVTATLKGRRK